MLTKYGIPDPSTNADRVAVVQPKFQNNFILEFDFKNKNEEQGVRFASNVVSCEIPKPEFAEVHTTTYWSHGYTYGRPTWSPIQVVVRDDIRSYAMSTLGNIIQKQTNKYFPTNEEKFGRFSVNSTFNMKIHIVSGQYDRHDLETWNLRGCYINSADLGSLSYENDTEVKTLSMGIRFNHVEHTIHNLPIMTNPDLRRQEYPTYETRTNIVDDISDSVSGLGGAFS